MTSRLLSCLMLLSAATLAQISPPLALPMPYSLTTGILSHNQSGVESVFTYTISVPGASSLQVFFETALLGSDEDAIVLTGTLDGESHTLDRIGLKYWRNHSAWFNGSVVSLDVRLAQGSTAQIVVTRVYAGVPPPPGLDTICGSGDDRVLTTDARCCRLVTSATVGCLACSGFLINNRSTILSAGHCANPVPDWLVVAEFNFGTSQASGCVTHPPVADQFPVDQSTIWYSDNGRGDDWSVARLHPNSTGQTAAQRQGTWFTLAGAMPANGSTLRITGNGADSDSPGTFNYALQTDIGTLSTISGDEIRHRVDTEGGSSGSVIINNTTGQAIGIHGQGGCDNTAGSYNSGTRILKAALQAAITNVSGCASVSLNSGVSAAISCTPAIYDVGPAAGRWTGVGITSGSDWDINVNLIGTTTIVTSGLLVPSCDFVIANGHLGTVSPVSGEMYRFTGADTARGECHDAISMSVGTSSSTSWSSTRLLRLFEFNVTTAGNYDVTVTGDSALGWRLYPPGTNDNWRSRSSTIEASGTVGGATASSVSLGAGWHCLVVFKDGGVAAVANTALSVTVCSATTANALTANVPETITASCQDFSVAPSAGNFNVVAITSPSSWAVAMGGGYSNSITDCDFVIADGHAGAITPTTGQFIRTNGSGNGTAEHRTASGLTIGSNTTATIAAGAVCAVRQFNVTSAGTYQVTVTGAAAAGFYYRVFDSGGSASWRPRSDTLNTAAAVGSAPTSLALAAGWHAIVVYKNAGPAAASTTVMLQVCQTASATTLNAFSPLTITGPCQTFTCTPDAGMWNAVGVSSDSDWDVGLGDAYSRSGGTTTDFVISNGHLGTASPTSGIASRFGGTDDARLQRSYNITLTVGTSYNIAGWPTNYVVRMFEFQVPAADDYDITLSGATALGWRLYAPGTDASWRSRQVEAALASGTVNGTTVTRSLSAGWHGIAVFHDGGAASTSLVFTVLAELTPNPVPAITTLAPSSAIAGSAGFPMTVTGTGFYNGSTVRWNGANLPTAFVSATQLTSSVPPSLIAAAGSASIQVFNPAPGGGQSAITVLPILAPIVASIAPATIAVMTPVSPPVPVTLTGANFLPTTVVYANSNALPTVYVNATTLTCTVGPSILQTQEIGGIAVAVENGHVAWSNARALRVGVGSNQGTVVRHPLDPLPGEAYAAFLEGGYPLAPFTLVIDVTHPAPVHPFPDPTGDFVLSVRPFVAPNDPTWLAFDGIGIYGPSIGLAFDAAGQAAFPGFVAPNPPLGVNLTVQSVYLDPTAALGFRLGWARWPDEL